jgi:mono/diheme cytochrome c family protein
MKQKYTSKLLLLTFLFFFFSVKVKCQNTTWVAPASANSLTNPLKGDAEAIKQGKVIYQSMCAVCHGDKGKGNGVAGVTLSPAPANFLSIRVRDESDGAIFWKLTEGNPPMASYKTLLSETQRWQLVNYLRQLELGAK